MSQTHAMRQYDEELERLSGEIVAMGELALHQLDAALQVLQSLDADGARAVIAGDTEVDALEHEIGHDVLRLLALRQPIARDLREILAALKIAGDVERIGDLAANAAKRSLKLRNLGMPALRPRLAELAAVASELVREALAAYRGRDADRAQAVRARDAELDLRHTAIFRELIAAMAQDPGLVEGGIHLLFIAKNLERIGDHATNIAENVWFIVHGELPVSRRRQRDTASG